MTIVFIVVPPLDLGNCRTVNSILADNSRKNNGQFLCNGYLGNSLRKIVTYLCLCISSAIQFLHLQAVNVS